MPPRTAIVIGAGPAGLTAAYELLEKTDVRPIVFEAGDDVGGLSRTIEYKGNRIDIGGHRFFSRSDRVMNWWQSILPLQEGAERGVEVSYQNKTRTVSQEGPAANPERDERVMLVRERVSRIFFLRKFFAYPVSLSLETLSNLGPVRTVKIGLSYLGIRVKPRAEEKSLEDFFVNRFGNELYRTFFKDYTEKVWGVPCDEIKPEWGSQRVKGLSVTKAIVHAIRSRFSRDESIGQKRSETSLIERFLYPKYGPGQMWREVARLVRERGGEIRMGRTAVAVRTDGDRVVGVDFRNAETGEIERVDGDFVFSTMPMQDLVRGMTDVPEKVRRVADGLVYRDFITCGLLLRKLAIRGEGRPDAPAGLVPDNWIYIQERDVRIGRLQIFNNWSPWLVRDPGTVWLGLEYFCNEGDDLWRMSDEEFKAFATAELAKIDVIDPADVLDGVVIRVPKTYPAYFGSYDDFDVLREWIDRFGNLYLVGRNGMHRYNNQDHSMLTAMTAVENLRDGVASKDNIWAVNTEEDYHEEK
ncbi:MAG: NAD(P)/FAD-dependent oxidoreductase [Planctomycetes bacterium]|nr:NAD(P)/FAD-dependent oxidoreductase [Planctomycetota bacterium]